MDNTRRLKEKEDELNFLPAQRANMGPRTAIMARKDEGLEDHRYERLDDPPHPPPFRTNPPFRTKWTRFVLPPY